MFDPKQEKNKRFRLSSLSFICSLIHQLLWKDYCAPFISGGTGGATVSKTEKGLYIQ